MGKGDRKTAKGKRYNASYGNSRSQKVAKVAVGAAAPVVKKTVVKAPAKKQPAKTPTPAKKPVPAKAASTAKKVAAADTVKK